jgi:hypothetical protein
VRALVVRAVILVVLAGALTACGQQAAATAPNQAVTRVSKTSGPAVHPHAIQPVAGGSPSSRLKARTGSPPAAAPPTGGLAQPTSLAEVRKQLAASGLSASLNRATLTPDGLALAPVTAPTAVQEIINAGNEIAHLPYRFGGGHGTYEDTAYDCSGSLSFVLAAAGILHTTVTSGQLMQWGRPGPGKWVTIFANQGHTFMYVAGLRFDTVALAETGTRWSNRPANEPDLASFAVRHPPGL